MINNYLHIAHSSFKKLVLYKLLGLLCLVFLPPLQSIAQVITNSGAVISVSGGTGVTTKDLTITSGSVNNDGTLKLSGNWSNSGTHNPGTGTVLFEASDNQTIANPAGETFNNLEVNNSGAGSGKVVKLNNNTTINTKLDIQQGLVQTGTSNVTNNGITSISTTATLNDNLTGGSHVFKGKTDINGTWNFSGGNGTVEFQGDVTNNGSFSSGTGTYTFSTNPINLTANNTISILGDVIVSGAAVIASGTVNVGDASTDNFTINSGSFNTSTSVFTVSGPTQITGTLSDNNSTGSDLFKGKVTINAGGGWNFNGNPPLVELQKGLAHNGTTFISGTGTYLFSTNNQDIEGASEIVFNGITRVGTNVALTNKNTFDGTGVTFIGNLDGDDVSSSFHNQNIASYEYTAEPMQTGTFDASYNGNIFRYSGATQTMAADAEGTYYHLVASGSGTKTFNGNVTVSNDLDINNVVLAYGGSSAYTLDVTGNLNASVGTVDMDNGTNVDHLMKLYGTNNTCNQLIADDQSEIQYLAAANNQNVFASPNYRRIRFIGGTKTLTGDINAGGNFIDLSSLVYNGQNTVYLSDPNVNISRTSPGTFIGKLKRALLTVLYDYFFPVGTDTSYNPLHIKFGSLTAGDYQVDFKTGDIGGAASLPMQDGNVEVYEQFKNGYWETKAYGSLVSNNYDLALTADGFNIDASSRILKKESGNLFVDGVHGSVSSDDITRNTLSGLSNINTSFGIINGRPFVVKDPRDTIVCNTFNPEFELTVTGQGTLTYQWEADAGSGYIPLNDVGIYNNTHTAHLTITGVTLAMNNYRYRLKITDGAGHVKISNEAVLKVNPIPVLTLVQNADTICNNTHAIINPISDVSDSHFTWVPASDTGITNASSGMGTIIDQILGNSNLAWGKVIYSITPIGPVPTSCVGLPKEETVFVEPTVNFTMLNDTLCNEGATAINPVTNNTTKGNIRYTWNVTTPAGTSGQNNSSGNGYNLNSPLVQNIENSTNEYKIVEYTVTPWIVDINNNNACQGVDSISRIYVNPTPRVNVVMPDTIYCNKTDVSFVISTPTIATGPIRLDIENSSTPLTGYTSGDDLPCNDITNNLQNGTNSAQSVTYTFKPVIKGVKNSFCKDGVDTSITVYVNPTPHVFASTPDTLFCNDQDIPMAVETLNGSVFGEKYYYFELEYDSAKLAAVGPDKEFSPLTGKSDNISNKTTALQHITYKIYPKIKNPRYNASIEYCENGVDTSFIRYILPTLKSTLVAKEYVNGWNEPCYGDAKGQINISLDGGMRVLNMANNEAQYTWSGLNTNIVTKDTLVKGLKIGTYIVKIKDTHQCEATDSLELFQPTKLLADSKIVTKVECTSSGSGKIAGRADGGTPGYKYQWYYGVLSDKTPKSSTDTAYNCSFGTYLLIVTDSNSCTNSDTVFIDVKQTPLNIDLYPYTYSNYNISCPGEADGGFTPTKFIPTSTITYTYEWYKKVNNIDSLIYKSNVNGNISGLSAGHYKLTVTNSLKCSGSVEDTLIEPSPVEIKATLSKPYKDTSLNISCDDVADGEIKLELKGGHGNYINVWSCENENHYVKNNLDVVYNLDAGYYYVTVYDTSNRISETQTIKKRCEYRDTFVLTKPDPLTFTAMLSDTNGYNIDCYGSSTGSINTLVTGGTGEYTYNWYKEDEPAVVYPNSGKIAGLKAGKYNVEIKYGEHGCSMDTSVTLTQPKLIENTVTYSNIKDSNITCYGGKDGFIKTDVTGGIKEKGYTYLWTKEGANTTWHNKDLTKVGAGKYILLVKDANGCKASWNYLLNQPNPVEAITIVRNPNCYLSNNGSASVSMVNGGIRPYTYRWSTGETDSTIDKLAKGSYYVIVFDNKKCFDSVPVIISEPDKLIVNIVADTIYNGRNISCYLANDARLKAVVNGGTLPYSYNWTQLDGSNSNATYPNSPILDSLSIGKYALTVIDVERCHDSETYIVTQPDKLKLAINSENVKCNGEFNGMATANVNGGTRPYKYNWLTAGLDSVASNLSAGIYSVSVNDANDCPITGTIEISEPSVLEVELVSAKEPYCPATSDGYISIKANGGSLPYEFRWDNGLNGDSIAGIFQGDYVYTVIDSNNCTVVDTIKLVANHHDCVDIPKAFSPNNDGFNDTWNILVGDPNAPIPLSQLYPASRVEIFNRWGSLVYRSEKGYGNEWNGKARGEDVPMASYYYSIDLGNGTEKIVGIVSIIR